MNPAISLTGLEASGFDSLRTGGSRNSERAAEAPISVPIKA